MCSRIAQFCFSILIFYFIGPYSNYGQSHSQKTNPGYFWLLSDPHVDLEYTKLGCKPAIGTYGCDSPLKLWISALNNTHRLMKSKPEFVIFSGDSAAHMPVTNEELVIKELKAVSRQMRLFFSYNGIATPLLPVFGNHDSIPQMDPSNGSKSRRNWCHKLAYDNDLWASMLGSVQNQQLFSEGCYFSKQVKIKSEFNSSNSTTFYLISLNGFLWYAKNPLSNDSIIDPAGQFAWLIQTLDQVRNFKTKALLNVHFPPGGSANSPKLYRQFHPVYNEKFLTVLQEYADVITAALFGHQHVDSFGVIAVKDKPKLTLFLNPSISPKTLGYASFNPRMRVYEFNRRSLEILDYKQFLFNISNPNPVWREDYSAKHEYGLADLSSISMSRLMEDFHTDDEKWCRYWKNEVAIRQPGVNCPAKDDPRRCSHLCAMTHFSFPLLDDCLTRCKTTKTVDSESLQTNWNTLPFIAAVIIAFLVILIGIVLCVNREICRRQRGINPNRLISSTFLPNLNFNQNAYSLYSDVSNHETGLSRNSSLCDIIELNLDGDQGNLIQSTNHSNHSSGLNKFTAKFNRPSSHSTKNNNINASLNGVEFKPTLFGVKQNGTLNASIVSNVEFKNHYDYEEAAYDAELEDEEDEEEMSIGRIPSRNTSDDIFTNGSISHLDTDLLISTDSRKRKENSRYSDVSDNEYYSIHNSFQCLQPQVRTESNGAASAIRSNSKYFSTPNKDENNIKYTKRNLAVHENHGEALSGNDSVTSSLDTEPTPTCSNSDNCEVYIA